MLKTTGFPATRTGDQTIVDGNLIPATAAKGINFTANTPAAGMTSRLLNWYEEGTWTPQYTNSTPPTTPYGMTISSATYTRVGRQVTVRAYISTSSVNTSGASGELRIANLPFTSAVNNDGVSAGNVGAAFSWASNVPLTIYVPNAANFMYLMYRGSVSGGTSFCDETSLTTGATAGQNLLIFCATYFV